MANLMRLVFMVVSGLAITLAAAAQQPDWAHRLGLEAQWSGDDSFYYPPDQGNDAILQRIQEKDRISKELIEGRLTLREAIALFIRLDEDSPTPASHPQYLGLSKEEVACRQIIEWVRQRVQDDSPDSARIIARFEDELRQHKEWDKAQSL
jgi:hypothetical protein